MGLWVTILLVSFGVPSIGILWWAGKAIAQRESGRIRRMDGDQYDADEMMAAFGGSQEWV